VLSDDATATIRRARRDPTLVLLEGLHALKHAVRFGAVPLVVASPDPTGLDLLLGRLAPDVAATLGREAVVGVGADAWREATGGRPLPSPCLAVVARPAVTATDVLARPGRVLLLEAPRHLGNLGAVVRVAAAAELAGVLVAGGGDPWHPTAVRAAAGLQFATAVARVADTATALAAVTASGRPLVALDPQGEALERVALPRDGVVALGTERDGLSPALRARATARLAIPMRDGVSSLNLATAAAVIAYRP
jgi:TrmH family RNA methyltransferase